MAQGASGYLEAIVHAAARGPLVDTLSYYAGEGRSSDGLPIVAELESIVSHLENGGIGALPRIGQLHRLVQAKAKGEEAVMAPSEGNVRIAVGHLVDGVAKELSGLGQAEAAVRIAGECVRIRRSAGWLCMHCSNENHVSVSSPSTAILVQPTGKVFQETHNLLQLVSREEVKCSRCRELGVADVVFTSGQLPIVAVDDWDADDNLVPLRPTKTKLFDMAYSRMKEEQPCCIVGDQVYALYCVVCLVGTKDNRMGRYVTYTFDALNQEWACFDGTSCKSSTWIDARDRMIDGDETYPALFFYENATSIVTAMNDFATALVVAGESQPTSTPIFDLPAAPKLVPELSVVSLDLMSVSAPAMEAPAPPSPRVADTPPLSPKVPIEPAPKIPPSPKRKVSTVAVVALSAEEALKRAKEVYDKRASQAEAEGGRPPAMGDARHGAVAWFASASHRSYKSVSNWLNRSSSGQRTAQALRAEGWRLASLPPEFQSIAKAFVNARNLQMVLAFALPVEVDTKEGEGLHSSLRLMMQQGLSKANTPSQALAVRATQFVLSIDFYAMNADMFDKGFPPLHGPAALSVDDISQARLPKYSYSLTLTGHALSALLADYCSFKFSLGEEGGVRQAYYLPSVTFESPGSAALLRRVAQSSGEGSNGRTLDKVHLVEYLSAPNPANTVGKHVLCDAYAYYLDSIVKSNIIPGKRMKQRHLVRANQHKDIHRCFTSAQGAGTSLRRGAQVVAWRTPTNSSSMVAIRGNFNSGLVRSMFEEYAVMYLAVAGQEESARKGQGATSLPESITLYEAIDARTCALSSFAPHEVDFLQLVVRSKSGGQGGEVELPRTLATTFSKELYDFLSSFQLINRGVPGIQSWRFTTFHMIGSAGGNDVADFRRMLSQYLRSEDAPQLVHFLVTAKVVMQEASVFSDVEDGKAFEAAVLAGHALRSEAIPPARESSKGGEKGIASNWLQVSKISAAVLKLCVHPKDVHRKVDTSMDIAVGGGAIQARQLLPSVVESLQSTAEKCSLQESGEEDETAPAAFWYASGLILRLFPSNRWADWQHSYMMSALNAVALSPSLTVLPLVIVLRGTSYPALASLGTYCEGRVPFSYIKSEKSDLLDLASDSDVSLAALTALLCSLKPLDGGVQPVAWRAAVTCKPDSISPTKDITSVKLTLPSFARPGAVNPKVAPPAADELLFLAERFEPTVVSGPAAEAIQSASAEEMAALWLHHVTSCSQEFRLLYDRNLLKKPVMDMVPQHLAAVLFVRLDVLAGILRRNPSCCIGQLVHDFNVMVLPRTKEYALDAFALHRDLGVKKKQRGRDRGGRLRQFKATLQRSTTRKTSLLVLSRDTKLAATSMQGLHVGVAELLDAVRLERLPPERQKRLLFHLLPRYLGSITSTLVLRGLDFAGVGWSTEGTTKPLVCHILQSCSLQASKGNSKLQRRLQEVRLIDCHNVTVESLQYVALLCPHVRLVIHSNCSPVNEQWKELRQALYSTPFHVLLPAPERHMSDYEVVVPCMTDRNGHAMELAVKNRNEEALRLLLSCNCEGTKAAMDVAIADDFEEGMNLLLRHSTGDQLRDAIGRFLADSLHRSSEKLGVEECNDLVINMLEQYSVESRQVVELLRGMPAMNRFQPSQQIMSGLTDEGRATVEVYELVCKGDHYMREVLTTPTRELEDTREALQEQKRTFRRLLKATTAYNSAMGAARTTVAVYWLPVIEQKEAMLLAHFSTNVAKLQRPGVKLTRSQQCSTGVTQVAEARQMLVQSQRNLMSALCSTDISTDAGLDKFRDAWRNFAQLYADMLADWVELFSNNVQQGRCDAILRTLGYTGMRTVLPDQSVAFCILLFPTNHKGDDVELEDDATERLYAATLTAWLQLLVCLMGQTPVQSARQVGACHVIKGFSLCTGMGYSPVDDPRFVLTPGEFLAMQYQQAELYEEDVADRLLFSSETACLARYQTSVEGTVRAKYSKMLTTVLKSKKLHKSSRVTRIVKTALHVLQLPYITLEPWRNTMRRVEMAAAKMNEWVPLMLPPEGAVVFDLDLLFKPLFSLVLGMMLRDGVLQREDMFWAWISTNQTRHQQWKRAFISLCQLRCKAMEKFKHSPLVMSAVFDEASAPGPPEKRREQHAAAQELVYTLTGADLQLLVNIVAFLFSLPQAKQSSDIVKNLHTVVDACIARQRSGDAPCAWHRGIVAELVGMPTTALKEYERVLKDGVNTMDMAYDAEMLNLSIVGLVRLRPDKYSATHGTQAGIYSAAKAVQV